MRIEVSHGYPPPPRLRLVWPLMGKWDGSSSQEAGWKPEQMDSLPWLGSTDSVSHVGLLLNHVDFLNQIVPQWVEGIIHTGRSRGVRLSESGSLEANIICARLENSG